MHFISTTIPIDNDHFILVLVWSGRQYYESATHDSKEHIACFIEYVIEDPDGKRIQAFPMLGSVHFIKNEMDAGVVAHEFTHVAFRLAEMLDNHDEEFVCDVVQNMNRDFWEAVQNNPQLKNWIYEDGYGEEEEEPY